VEDHMKSICTERDNSLIGNDRLIVERQKHYSLLNVCYKVLTNILDRQLVPDAVEILRD